MEASKLYPRVNESARISLKRCIDSCVGTEPYTDLAPRPEEFSRVVKGTIECGITAKKIGDTQGVPAKEVQAWAEGKDIPDWRRRRTIFLWLRMLL